MKIKKYFSNAFSLIGGGVVVAAAISSIAVSAYVATIHNRYEKQLYGQFVQMYGTNLLRDGDTDGDGIISPKEANSFNGMVFEGKDVLWEQGKHPIFVKSGKDVPLETLVEWLREYEKRR